MVEVPAELHEKDRRALGRLLIYLAQLVQNLPRLAERTRTPPVCARESHHGPLGRGRVAQHVAHQGGDARWRARVWRRLHDHAVQNLFVTQNAAHRYGSRGGRRKSIARHPQQ